MQQSQQPEGERWATDQRPADAAARHTVTIDLDDERTRSSTDSLAR
ncbi:hypothetical protein AB0L53_11825 [Nonomuraea sp. NPDC052129]